MTTETSSRDTLLSILGTSILDMPDDLLEIIAGYLRPCAYRFMPLDDPAESSALCPYTYSTYAHGDSKWSEDVSIHMPVISSSAVSVSYKDMMIFVGGYDENAHDNFNTAVWAFSTRTHTCTRLAPMIYARISHTVTVVGDHLVVTGGQVNPQPGQTISQTKDHRYTLAITNRCEILDLRSPKNTWVEIAPMMIPRFNHYSVAHQGCLYAYAGTTTSVQSNQYGDHYMAGTIERLTLDLGSGSGSGSDIKSKSKWEYLADNYPVMIYPQSYRSPIAFAIRDHLYFVGYNDVKERHDKLYQYDVKTNVWNYNFMSLPPSFITLSILVHDDQVTALASNITSIDYTDEVWTKNMVSTTGITGTTGTADTNPWILLGSAQRSLGKYYRRVVESAS
jgi:hypothetical protein